MWGGAHYCLAICVMPLIIKWSWVWFHSTRQRECCQALVAQHAICTKSVYDSYWSCVIECSDGSSCGLGRCGLSRLSCVSPLPWEVLGPVCIRPKLMMITLNSAACCFQGPFSTSPSPANLAPGYSSIVESGSSEVLHIFPTFHLLMAARYCSAEIPMLIHWVWVTHKCISNLIIIGSDNGLIWNLGTNLSEIHIFSFKKMHLKMLSGKFWLSCSGLNMLTVDDKSSGYPVVNGLMLTF